MRKSSVEIAKLSERSRGQFFNKRSVCGRFTTERSDKR